MRLISMVVSRYSQLRQSRYVDVASKVSGRFWRFPLSHDHVDFLDQSAARFVIPVMRPVTLPTMATFSYSLVPQCLMEATEAGLTSYLSPFLFLSDSRSGTAKHKPNIRRIHETAMALAVFQQLLIKPKLSNYDIRWEHELRKPKGSNVPRADLFLSPQGGAGGVKTYVEVGRIGKDKVISDASKLVKYRPNDALFLLLLDLEPPEISRGRSEDARSDDSSREANSRRRGARN